MSSKKDSKKTPSKLNYLYQNTQKSVKDDKVEVLEEIVVDGPRGLKINYYMKSGNTVEKIVIFGKDDSFKMKSVDGEKTLTKTELLNEIKSNKKLKFASEFAKTQKGGNVMTGGAKKSSKKGSKKTSKKVSKKSSKKGSKKTSKKVSKKSSKTMKGGKKNSKKSSKKLSKTMKGGKKSSKKSSKKLSKTMKGGKKSSKRTSKKTSKTMKGGKKKSKKGSKKSSKKGSKKVSKNSSKK